MVKKLVYNDAVSKLFPERNVYNYEKYVKDSVKDGNEAKIKELEKDIAKVEKDLQEHIQNKENTSGWMKRKVFLESTVARYKKQLSQLKDSCKDEAIYKWMADPEDEQDLIEEAKKLGCQLQKIGSLIQVTGPISKLAKVLGETEESIIKASQQRMSTIKKVKDVDTYKEVTKELEKETYKLKEYFDDSIYVRVRAYDTGSIHVFLTFDSIDGTNREVQRLINDFNENNAWFRAYVTSGDTAFLELHFANICADDEEHASDVLNFALGQLLEENVLTYLKPLLELTY